MNAYGFKKKGDALAQLLKLNHAVAEATTRGDAVESPGPPSTYTNTSSLVTTDCLKP